MKNSNTALQPSHQGQSLGEEIANSISHGLGFVAALVGTPFLIIHAVKSGDVSFIVGASVFSATMLMLYLASTMYHAFPRGTAKRFLMIIDHSAIFLLIAGTYTPFTLGVLSGAWGWTLLGLVWGLAIAGVVLKVFDRMSHPIISTGIYLIMGWLVLIAIDPLVTRMPPTGLYWLLAGGLAYTVGIAFFAVDWRLRYSHFIWHLFVILGTACHYFAVFLYSAGHPLLV